MENSFLKRMEKILWAAFAVCGAAAAVGIFLLVNTSQTENETLTEEEHIEEEVSYDWEMGLSDSNYWLPSEYSPCAEIPEIIFTDGEGKEHSIREWRGGVTVLVFWASWCDDCKEQMSCIGEYMESAKEAGNVSFLFVNKTDGEKETKESAKAYFGQLGLECETYYGVPEESFDTLGIRNIPTVLFLDKEGRMAACSPRQLMNKGEFEALLKNAVTGSGKVTAEFVKNYMTDEEGGVHSTYVQGEGAAQQPEVLSESQGLMLLYAAEAGEQELFDRTLAYIRNYMWNGGLAAWRVEHGTASGVNALLDDLRIYRGLRQAEEVWGGYQEDIKYCEESLERYGIKKSGYVDFYDKAEGEYASRFTLCYADLEAMQLLAEKGGKFEKAYKKAESVLEGGRISEEFPLYYSWYNYSRRRYEKDDLNTAEAMVTLLHLARQDKLPDNSIQWLKGKISTDGIKARYSIDGQVVDGYDYESSAVYALVAMIAREAGDDILEGQALRKMEKMRIADISLEYNGAFGMADGSGITSFDQLMPVLAYTCNQ